MLCFRKKFSLRGAGSLVALLLVCQAATGCIVATQTGFEGYKRHLAAQEGEAVALPESFIKRAQPFYSVPLHKVRYFQNIDTISGMVVTIGHKIYFPNDLRLDRGPHIRRLLHELRHVEQFAKDGDLFFQNYQSQGLVAAVSSVQSAIGAGGPDVHGKGEYERQAALAESEVFPKLKIVCAADYCPAFVPPTSRSQN